MSCPACGEPLASGATLCLSCGTLVAPPVEGALAPDPARVKVEPLREIPGARKRERTWKDEVRERVRHRRRERTGSDLPLFPEGEDVAPDAAPAPLSEETEEPPVARTSPLELAEEPLDLPLRKAPDTAPITPLPVRAEPRIVEEPPEELSEAADEEELAPSARGETAYPVERPAGALERAQAAVLDLGLLLGMWALVLYFAGRAAHTGLSGLTPAWPWLAAYLAGLGFAYAVYFTGVTGQTLGKLALGLRVVTSNGQPPGPVKALGRALVGVIGIALAFGGLVPVLFDPAKRALHDRLLKTRVIKG